MNDDPDGYNRMREKYEKEQRERGLPVLGHNYHDNSKDDNTGAIILFVVIVVGNIAFFVWALCGGG